MHSSDPSPLHRFLKKLTRHSLLNEAEQQAVLTLRGRPAQVQTNRDFVRLGERVDHACLVVDGLVGRFGQNREGARQITGLYIAGDMVNLHSIIAPDATSAVQALTVSTIVQVPHSALRELTQRYPALAETFWRECVVESAILAEWTVNVGRRDARSRTAHLLCEMACRYDNEVTTAGFRFRFPATQNHLADILALTSVHVNRTLKALREEGAVQVYGREVHVLDWDRLVDIGEFDPAYLQIGKSPRANQRLYATG